MNASNNPKTKLWNYHFVYLILLSVIALFPSTMITATLSTYVVDHYDVTSSQVGFVTSLMMLSTLAFRPFTGYIVDRWGRKITLACSLLIIALINFSMLFPMNITVLGVLQLIIGVPFSLFSTAIHTLTADVIPEEVRAEGFSVSSILTLISAVAIAPNLAFLILGASSFNLLFAIAGCIGILAIITILFMPFEDIRNHAAKFSFSTIFELKVSRITFVIAFLFLGWPGLLTFGPLYSNELGIGKPGIFLLSYGFGLLISRWLSKCVVDLKIPNGQDC